MPSPTTVAHRKAFCARLKQALNNANYPAHSPVVIRRNFNARYAGKEVSSECVRKWLAGESTPTVDKVATLAKWLHVSVDWLSFGITKSEIAK